MKKAVIIFLSTIVMSCVQVQTQTDQTSEEDLTNLVTIKDFNSTKQGYGQNVVAEIENKSNKKVTFVSVEFTWYDKKGNLITSQKGNTKDINPNSTGLADSYFDEMPKGATYKARINQVIF
jgi:uncharacterized protein YcfL